MSRTSIKATKKWWKEGKGHIEAKRIVKAILKKYRWASTEEEPYPVDLHEIWPEEYPKQNRRGYQMDIVANRGRQGEKRLIQIDGEYHEEPKQEAKDRQQDAAILAKYGEKVFRLSKLDILRGTLTEERIAEILEL